jgi:arginyl-tRNA synthetase
MARWRRRKAARANPRVIAEKIAARLKSDARFAKVEIAGPGFINLDLTDAALAKLLAGEARYSNETGKGKKLVIDFGGPNIAKPMHVGHLRSSIIGDCLQRLYRANGWRVFSDVHLGDWGLQMGQLISEDGIARASRRFISTPLSVGPYPQQSPVTMEDLEKLYPAAAAACKADPARLEAARRATVDLQDGRPGYRALWRHFVEVSEAGWSANSRPGDQVRSVERRIQCRCADRPMIEESEEASVWLSNQRRRAGGPGGRGERQEADASPDPGEVRRRRALRHHRSCHHPRTGARIRS